MTTPKKATKSVTAVNKANKAALAAEDRAHLARKAMELRQAGRSWWDIAEELKVTEKQAGDLIAESIKAASALVDEGMKQNMLSMELNRLDRLQFAIWQDAIGGDRQAIETALKIIQARSKILGLDNIQTNTVTHNTIVVAGTSEEYINALRKVADIPVIEHEE